MNGGLVVLNSNDHFDGLEFDFPCSYSRITVVEPGNEMYGYYFCPRCTWVLNVCMSVEKK